MITRTLNILETDKIIYSYNYLQVFVSSYIVASTSLELHAV